MMYINWIFILVIIGWSIQRIESFVSVELEVEHCFGDDNFKKAGTITADISITVNNELIFNFTISLF